MKMSNLTLTVIAGTILLLSLTGCTTYYKDANGDYLKYPVSTGSSDYFTEYEIGAKKIDGRSQTAVILGTFHVNDGKYCALGANPNLSFMDLLLDFFSPTGKAISNAKNSAVYDAVESNMADFLVGTVFSYTVRNYLIFSTVDCKISAFPAVVKKISPAKKIILNSDQRIVTVNPNIELTDYSDKENVIKVVSGKQSEK